MSHLFQSSKVQVLPMGAHLQTSQVRTRLPYVSDGVQTARGPRDARSQAPYSRQAREPASLLPRQRVQG